MRPEQRWSPSGHPARSSPGLGHGLLVGASAVARARRGAFGGAARARFVQRQCSPSPKSPPQSSLPFLAFFGTLAGGGPWTGRVAARRARFVLRVAGGGESSGSESPCILPLLSLQGQSISVGVREQVCRDMDGAASGGGLCARRWAGAAPPALRALASSGVAPGKPLAAPTALEKAYQVFCSCVHRRRGAARRRIARPPLRPGAAWVSCGIWNLFPSPDPGPAGAVRPPSPQMVAGSPTQPLPRAAARGRIPGWTPSRGTAKAAPASCTHH